MKVSWLDRFFPLPNTLRCQSLGLDLSDRSLKYAKLNNNQTSVISIGERELPPGLISGGKIINQHDLVENLRELRSLVHGFYIAVALPEELSFTFPLRLPRLKRKADLQDAIAAQLEEHVPINLAEAVFDFELLSNTTDNQGEVIVLVSACTQALTSSYCQAVEAAGFIPTVFELEMTAAGRAVIPPSSTETVLLIDFGKTRTSLAVISRGQTVLSATVAGLSGDALTRAIQKHLGLTVPEAEKLKIERGLWRPSQDQRLPMSIIPILSALRDEITKFEDYWSKQEEIFGTEWQPISQIVLIGGQAALPGLVEYFAAGTKPITLAGNVWQRVLDSEKVLPPIPRRESYRYAAAIGLALGGN